MQREVTLNPGESQKVSFTIEPHVEGEYTIQLNGLGGLLDVTSAPVAEFEVSGLSITPAEVHIRSSAEVKAVVTNIGDAIGSYTVICIVTPDICDIVGGAQREVTLSPGESQEVSFIIEPIVVGEYTIQVNGLTGLLSAALAPAAEFELSDLSIVPAEMSVGDSVEISGTVTNIGDAVGSYTVVCNVTPGTYTPLGVVPAVAVSDITLPLNDIINMMMIVVFMSMGIKMMGRL